MVTTMTLAVVVGAIALVQAGLGWRLFAAMREVKSLEARLARQADALSLLTETTESGFAAVAREIERQNTPAPKPRRASNRRVTGAAARGRSVAQIAAAAQMSEGEVRLRLAMADLPA